GDAADRSRYTTTVLNRRFAAAIMVLLLALGGVWLIARFALQQEPQRIEIAQQPDSHNRRGAPAEYTKDRGDEPADEHEKGSSPNQSQSILTFELHPFANKENKLDTFDLSSVNSTIQMRLYLRNRYSYDNYRASIRTEGADAVEIWRSR